jgi:hypothetical protein
VLRDYKETVLAESAKEISIYAAAQSYVCDQFCCGSTELTRIAGGEVLLAKARTLPTTEFNEVQKNG